MFINKIITLFGNDEIVYVLGCRNICRETVSECLYLFMCVLQSLICVDVCGCVCLVCFSVSVF